MKSKNNSNNQNKKLKMLPTLKEKKHYLVFIAENTDEKEVKESISNAILNYIGLLGFSKASPMFIEFKLNKEKNKGYCIFSVNTKYVDVVKNSVLIFPKFSISCIGVSGTIKKARRFYK